MAPELDEELLEDGARIIAADTQGWLRRTATAGAQIREVTALSEEAGVRRLASAGAPRAVLVAGSGEAAVIAPMLVALAGARSPAPIVSISGGALPSWAGMPDLVVVAGIGSGSSATEEELLLIADAAARHGASLLGIGRGSRALQERCARARSPYVDLPQDRAEGTSLWSLVTPVLILAEALGLIDVDLAHTPVALDAVAARCRPDNESFRNPGKGLALQLAGNAPLLVADSALTGVVAQRLQSQLAAVAGVPAPVTVLPDGQSEVAGYLAGPWAAQAAVDIFADPDDEPARPLRLVTLRDGRHPAGTVALRETVLRAEHAGVRISDLVAEEGNALAGAAGMIALADFACGYLRLATRPAGALP